MDELDRKLHDLLLEQAKSYYLEGSSEEWFEEEFPELAERFKQAFMDAGWVKLRNHEPVEKCFTGQEWYDRFRKELSEDSALFTIVSRIDRAAKKAAGLES